MQRAGAGKLPVIGVPSCTLFHKSPQRHTCMARRVECMVACFEGRGLATEWGAQGCFTR